MTIVALIVRISHAWELRQKDLHVRGVSEPVESTAEERDGEAARPLAEVINGGIGLTIVIDVALLAIVKLGESTLTNSLGPSQADETNESVRT
jgi:hypothetical protein